MEIPIPSLPTWLPNYVINVIFISPSDLDSVGLWAIVPFNRKMAH